MASAHDQEDVDIIEEVEDVMQELMKIANRPLHDEIDMNEIYDVLKTILNSESTTKTQRLMATVEIMRAKVKTIKKCQLEKSSATSCDDIFDNTSDVDYDEDNEENIGDTDYWKSSDKKHLNALIHLYPDVDRLTLKNKMEEFGSDSGGLQSWLTSNIAQLPERKQVLALARLQLTSRAEMNDKILSQCPSCDGWKMVDKDKTTGVEECDEIGCGIYYCLLCNRQDHRPFNCRKDDDIFRMRTAKDKEDLVEQRHMAILGERRDELAQDLQKLTVDPAQDTSGDRVKVEAAERSLECPICIELMRPPTRIWMCRLSHIICKPCKDELDKKEENQGICPTCMTERVNLRALMAENFARTIFND